MQAHHADKAYTSVCFDRRNCKVSCAKLYKCTLFCMMLLQAFTAFVLPSAIHSINRSVNESIDQLIHRLITFMILGANWGPTDYQCRERSL